MKSIGFRFRTVSRFLLLAAVFFSGCGPAPTGITPTPTLPPATPAPTLTQIPTAVPSPTQNPTQFRPSEIPTAAPSPTQPSAPTLAPGIPVSGQTLVDALRRGGYVIYFRHAATDQSQADTDTPELKDCTKQRNLNETGRADARRIGEAIRALEIPIGQVLSSGYCRTRETAELAFRRAEVTQDLTGFPAAQREQRIAALRQFLSTPPQPGTNTVLVAHGFNISNTANITIAEGEAAVFAPLGDGNFELVARVRPDEWSSLAPTPPALQVQEYPVPTGSHPHDIAPAPDGTVWYTAQTAGALGRLDPATGETHAISLGDRSAPHGVIVGPDGAAWVTDSGQNGIVRVDPGTESVKVFPLPQDSGNVNLNTAAFDRAGILWFTGQGGVYGRLDPKTGEMQVFPAPRGRGPYGITGTPDGSVYYASLAGSYVGRIDPAAGTAAVLEPPTPGQGARRVWSDSTGDVWVSEWNAGQVARYHPADNSWQEWKLPGERPQAYAVYVDDQDIVWLSDFGANALVRFDPRQEQFTVIPLPSPNGQVRQILGRPGEVWGAESGADKLVVIRTGGG